MNSADFYSKENMRTIVNIFKDFMLDKYDYTVEDEPKARKIVFDVMTDVLKQTNGKNVSMKTLNITVLNTVRDIYLKHLGVEQKKPNLQVLSREKSIYGNRQLHTSIPVPDADPYTKRNTESIPPNQENMERLILERDKDLGIDKKPMPDADKVIRPVTEKSESEEMFMKRLQDFKSQRKLIIDDLETKRDYIQNSTPPVPTPLVPTPLVPTPSPLPPSFTNYLLLNSSDRNLVIDPSRYKYTVIFPQFKYKNVDSIIVSKVVVPGILSHPYLLLKIDEFTDVYDGTNDIVKKSFCKLVYNNSHTCSNSRGYTILKPAQKEKKTFSPVSLPTLQKLSFSILQPNGALLNTTKDAHFIKKIQYDKDKPNLIKVTCEHYFDNGEFNIGDSIVIKDFEMTKLSSSQKEMDIKEFNVFINSPEGFVIMERGSVNEFDYCNAFYIRVPGTFNPAEGILTLKTNLTSCLEHFNSVEPNGDTNGFVLNLSLQNSIALQIITTEPSF